MKFRFIVSVFYFDFMFWVEEYVVWGEGLVLFVFVFVFNNF